MAKKKASKNPWNRKTRGTYVEKVKPVTVSLFSLAPGTKFHFPTGSQRWYVVVNSNEHGCLYRGFGKTYQLAKDRQVVKANFK